MSLPAWERGLKSGQRPSARLRELVAPRVGAWIEIGLFGSISTCAPVAPRVGAWIEICSHINPKELAPSLPAWERGLKCINFNNKPVNLASLPAWERGLKFYSDDGGAASGVAPRVGAWIEISVPLVLTFALLQSLPAWERGLKS